MAAEIFPQSEGRGQGTEKRSFHGGWGEGALLQTISAGQLTRVSDASGTARSAGQDWRSRLQHLPDTPHTGLCRRTELLLTFRLRGFVG